MEENFEKDSSNNMMSAELIANYRRTLLEETEQKLMKTPENWKEHILFYLKTNDINNGDNIQLMTPHIFILYKGIK